MNKWIGISLGAVVGLSHIGMIGLLSNRESKLPSLNVPVGPYTSYKAEVTKEGYKIAYKANDPKTMFITKDIKKKGASAAPSLANIPFIGWVAAGWVTMFSGNQGADIGGSMAESMSRDC